MIPINSKELWNIKYNIIQSIRYTYSSIKTFVRYVNLCVIKYNKLDKIDFGIFLKFKK